MTTPRVSEIIVGSRMRHADPREDAEGVVRAIDGSLVIVAEDRPAYGIGVLYEAPAIDWRRA